MKITTLLLLLLTLMEGSGVCQGPVGDTARPKSRTLKEVTVTGHVLPVERKRDKVIVNVEASVTNTGSTVLEVLERSPGVTVDRNGGISLNGKAGVLVMIDDKPTYLSGDDLNNLLSSMNSAQVARIELIANPTAKYDAAGSAGIINIKTKKSKSNGLNGSVTGSFGQGIYPKTNNSLVLNYRRGRVNAFLNYSFNDTKYLTNLYAYRQYFDANRDVSAVLQQPSYFSGTVMNNTVKAGVDYTLSASTTIGMAVTGTDIHRMGHNTATANWLRADGQVDSAILTQSRPENRFRNGAINWNGRQVLAKNAELTADVDYLHYRMRLEQDFDNRLLDSGGYEQVYRNDIPTTIDIFSAKADATVGLGSDLTLTTGFKTSSSHTDNAATYQDWLNQQWIKDETLSNHFVYRENIQAVYGALEGKVRRWSYQGGVRYEYTRYTAHQTGNSTQRDSLVSRNYGSFFPSGYLSYKLDTMNSLTLTVGRRVDRPVFQTLNPFLFVINKYTYETGNPYLLPQYTWNFELSHQYGNLLTTGISLARVSNYFSQIFLSDTSKTILYYTQGNVGRVYNLGLSMSLNVSPARWWSMALTAVMNHKQLRGFNGNEYTSTITQLSANINNQLSIGRGYAGEVSAFYTTRARNDIQELLYPTGQASVGVAKTVLKKKGTIKVSYRDIFYTNAMEGLTSFPDASEYFKIKRDSRVLTVAFTFRFGKSQKATSHADGASEEKERVQNG
ncbi:MAG TPA: outer membrane beta-barrel family protein [Puia sp.]|uniref:outer membrane beta-barrel family protein n=1 Tax=Puia sp. TaxID=2045100 RepID=UPI002CB61575|nr:outer membrane beta-barrel family protein [Puia sp.]HVU96035.1 outer membrane beta-barrel family protein [Puia sp.]